jgi:hypothetical protein
MLVLGSALLFGATTPIAKLLLGVADRLLLAGLLYRRIDRCDGHAGRRCST